MSLQYKSIELYYWQTKILLYLERGENMTEYFSYKQAMEYLGFDSYKSLASLIKSGLPTITVGKTKKISKSAIDKFMNEHQSVMKH